MAYDIHKNGAWQSPEQVRRYESGARKEVESVKRYTDGAWQEVWANLKVMTQKSNTITYGQSSVQNLITENGDGSQFNLWKYCNYQNGAWSGYLGGGGTIVFYLDGDWTDPSVSFDWTGGHFYSNVAGDSASGTRSASAGSVSIYSRNTSGVETFTSAVPHIGIDSADNIHEEAGTYSGSLSGKYNRIGIAITMDSFPNRDGYATIRIETLRLGGRLAAFPRSSTFDYRN